MIAVDTNILVYAHRRDHEWFDIADNAVRSLVEGPVPWAIPWPCLYEFTGVVTRARAFSPPSTLDQAVDQLDVWLGSPSVTVLGENAWAWPIVKDVLLSSKVTGSRVHDARIAALCRLHGVSELWTADRDFERFSVRTRNPLAT